METEARITGVMVYYYFVCKRKLWYFTHEIQMEQENEAVKLGKVLDESVYGRENKHMDIDQTINIDFIRETNILHEVKKKPENRRSFCLAGEILSVLSEAAGNGRRNGEN